MKEKTLSFYFLYTYYFSCYAFISNILSSNYLRVCLLTKKFSKIFYTWEWFYVVSLLKDIDIGYRILGSYFLERKCWSTLQMFVHLILASVASDETFIVIHVISFMWIMSHFPLTAFKIHFLSSVFSSLTII